MYSINFLQHRQKKVSQLEQQDRHGFTIVSIGFGILCVIAIGLFGVRWLWGQRVAKVLAYQKELEQQVTAQESTEQQYLFFISKLDLLHQIMEERRDKQSAIDYFSRVFGSEVLIENIAYDANRSTIVFGLKANDVFSLERVFNQLAAPETVAQFAKVEKKDLRRQEDGTYSLQVTVTFASTSDKKQ